MRSAMKSFILLLAIGCVYGFSFRAAFSNLLHKFEAADSCTGRCGEPFNSAEACQCNDACVSHNDCCADFNDLCSSNQNTCQDNCHADYDATLPCQCNDKCPQYGNCCPDYDDFCDNGGGGGGVTEQDLIALSETLFSLETNNNGDKITLELGCTTNNGNTQDCSPSPLFANVDPSAFDLPILQKLMALYDNYEISVSLTEDHTEQEHLEEMEFLQAVMDSPILQETFGFLVEKGVYTGSYEQFGEKMYTMWFGMYERSSGHLSSSGFEHVFIGEVKNGDVSGFHNWVRWYSEEVAGNMNYLGYWREASFVDQMGGGLEFTYFWNNVQKPYGSMFIGTSPELELALYTTCLLTMPDKQCHVQLGGTDVWIQTWTQYTNGELMVGSSYPDFAK